MFDGETPFVMRARFRLSAQKGYVKQDCSTRAAKAMLHKAAQAGDMACFRREQGFRDDTSAIRHSLRNQEPSTVSSTPSWIIGFEGETVWCLSEGVPVTIAMDTVRPCTAAEILACQFLSCGFDPDRPRDAQQGLVDQHGAPARDDHEDYEDVGSEHNDHEDEDVGDGREHNIVAPVVVVDRMGPLQEPRNVQQE